MSEGRRSGGEGPSEHCHLLEPALAAFVEGVLPSGKAPAVAEHVAGCGWCATRLALFAEVDTLLREAPTPVPPASLRAALYARITAEARRASQQHRTSEVASILRKTDTPHSPAESASPMPRSRQAPGPAAISRWVGLVAAVLIVALLAGIIAIRGQRGTDTGPAAQSTATDVLQRACAPDEIQARLPGRSRLADLAMTGPGTGWAVGSIADSDSASATYHTLMLGFSNCQWRALGTGIPNAGLGSIAMVSQHEGWAAGDIAGHTPLLLHYAEGSWSKVTPPFGDISRFLLVRALSTGEVWIVGRTPAGRRPSPGIAVLHYANGQWIRIETPFNEASDIAPTGPGDAWLAGYRLPNISTEVVELAHLQSGSLGAEVILDPRISLTHLRMSAPNEGWAMGSLYVSGNETGANPTVTRPIALHYDGSHWTEVHTGVSANARALDVFGQGSAWSYTTRGIPEYIVSTQRDHAGQWQNVAWPFKDIMEFSRLTCVTPDDCWAIGSYRLPDTTLPDGTGGAITVINFGSLLLRYANGAWHEYGHVQ